MMDDATRAAFLLGILDELTDNLFVLRDEIDQGERDEPDAVRRFTYVLAAALAAATEEQYLVRSVDETEFPQRLRDVAEFAVTNPRVQKQAWKRRARRNGRARITDELERQNQKIDPEMGYAGPDGE